VKRWDFNFLEQERLKDQRQLTGDYRPKVDKEVV